MFVNREEIKKARMANLYDYCMDHHSDLFIQDSVNTIKLKSNHSISIKIEYSGYTDFSTNETGNSVDFLTKHLGYCFVDAVKSLNNGNYTKKDTINNDEFKHDDRAADEKPPDNSDEEEKRFYQPEKNSHDRNVIAYLSKTRLISTDTIYYLIKSGLLYQDTNNNCAFINRDRNFGELRGTNTYIKFHGVVTNSKKNGYWSFCMGNDEYDTIAICESAIDAISLYELHRIPGYNTSKILYTSIAGVAKQQAIDKLVDINYDCKIYIAVDNDKAGDLCRENNKKFKYIIPMFKDWNEDLIRYRQKSNFCLFYTCLI